MFGSPRSRSFPAAFALVALYGCAAASSPGQSVPVEPGSHDDAGPHIYSEEEVDVVARPITPLRPVYPARLLEVGVEGDVEARIVVWPDGSVQGGELLSSSHPDFTEAARKALAEAHFAPGRLRGQPVPSSVTVRLRFRLER